MKKSLSEVSVEIYSKKLFDVSSSLICALSGGQDSQFLFYILLHIKKYCHLKLNTVYMHHFWQLSNFKNFIETWKVCFVFEIPFTVILTERSSERFLGKYSQNKEEEARNWRKYGFFRAGEFLFCNCICTGYTRTDSIETALWNLIRGTSPESLGNIKAENIFILKNYQIHFLKKSEFFLQNFYKNKNFIISKVPLIFFKKDRNIRGFYWSKSIKKTNILIKKNIYKISKNLNINSDSIRNTHTNFVVYDSESKKLSESNNTTKLYKKNKKQLCRNIRPLVDYSRSDITKILKKNFLPINPDLTNQSQKFTRNKIRSKLIPTIQTHYHNSFDFNVLNFLSINFHQQQFLKSIIKKIKRKNFSYLVFRTLPKAIQKQFLHNLCQVYTGRQVSFLQVEVIYTNIFVTK